jgi:hypothetical protein
MERVRQLSPAERSKIDGSWLQLFFVHAVRLAPLAAFWALLTPLIYRALLKQAFHTDSPVAEAAYRQFRRDLHENGWRLRGRMCILSGLCAIRRREGNPALAVRLYAAKMGKVVTRPSLGWNDSPVG